MYSFPNLKPVCCSMSASNCCFLTCIQISQEAGQVIWYCHLFKNFPGGLLHGCISLKSGGPACAAVQFSSVAQSCPTLCDPMDCSTPGLPVHHQLLEFTQTHVHWVGDAIQPSHPLLSPSPPAFNLSQQKGIFQGVSSLHQVAKVLEFQLQHQSFQRIFKTDFL